MKTMFDSSATVTAISVIATARRCLAGQRRISSAAGRRSRGRRKIHTRAVSA